MEQVDRYIGALLGLAVGDALGASLEFTQPCMFMPIDDMIGGGPFELEPGQWTDDTSMALCLTESLIEKEGFDPLDQMERYLSWYKEGYMSSTGYCFDIGNTVRTGLEKFEMTRQPFCGSTNFFSAGNGSLMRLAPVPLFYARQPEEAILKSGESSRTTHGHRLCIDACRYFGALLVGAINGVSKEELLSPRYSPVSGLWERYPLIEEVDEVAAGSFKTDDPAQIRSTGFVVDTLKAALWAFYHEDSFREGCLRAVNLGGDADTVGAVYGQIGGAYYGKDGIPDSWLEKLSHRKLIEKLAKELYRKRR